MDILRPLGIVGIAACCATLLGSSPGRAEQARSAIVVDQVVARWSSPATGGTEKPQFVLARELAFEARLEAMAEGLGPHDRFGDKHLRAALERHITETMLASLPIDPAPTPRQVAESAEAARLILEQRIEGRRRLHEAANEEGIVAEELNAMLRRRARASLYLDRMVAPMLEPTEADLREVHQSGESPFTDQPFDQVAPQLRRWLVATQLSSALRQYFRNARSRIELRLIGSTGRRRRR